MYEIELSSSPPPLRVIPEGEVREIRDPDDPALKVAGRLKDLDSPGPLIQRIKQGERCFVFSPRGEAVSFIWISREKWHQDNYGPHHLPPETAFMYDCITSPAWRGLSIYPYLIIMAGKYLYEEGDSTLLTLVNRENYPAIRSLENAGFKPMEKRVFRARKLGKTNPTFTIHSPG